MATACTPPSKHGHSLDRFAQRVTCWVGSTQGFLLALLIVLVWAATGPLFKFSDTWQLVINTGTTIITFLMVFLIQRSQNRDTLAVQLKLNEIIAALKGASNRLINVEDLSEEEIRNLRDRYHRLAESLQNDPRITASHSVEEAREAIADNVRKMAVQP